MEYRKIGYARVSTKEQNEARQVDKLTEAGVSERDLYVDKASGKDFNREQYQIMKRVLRKGDILYVHSLDRLGRNKDEILDEWKDITKLIDADIVVLDMPLLDTTKHKDSVGTFVADLVLQVLSWIAEDERERIRKRQREGIDAAQKRGQHLGRPRKSFDTLEPTERTAFVGEYGRWKTGEQTAVETFNKLNLTKTTFYKLVKEYEAMAID
ncbi:recombinase family protein [Solibacillus sp. FSL H8-0538]|uniref:recombinase family protein n=1 Tax=Solibacillus sp. FSL H8-0538 TaxID=2921400 RepID=UPI0030F5519A